MDIMVFQWNYLHSVQNAHAMEDLVIQSQESVLRASECQFYETILICLLNRFFLHSDRIRWRIVFTFKFFMKKLLNSYDLCKFTEGTQRDGDVNSVNLAILEIQRKDVNYVDAKPRDQRTTIVIEKVVNASAKRIMMDINVTSVR